MPRNAHRHVVVRLPVGPTEVDAAIAPLIRLCWAAKLRTEFCCEGTAKGKRTDPSGWGFGYIKFARPEFATAFYAACSRTTWSPTAVRQADRDYGRSAAILNWAVEREVVRFPTEDIPRALSALRRNRWLVEDLIVSLRAAVWGMRGSGT